MVDYYTDTFDKHWEQRDFEATKPERDFGFLIDQIVATCGGGRVLDVGCGTGLLVQSLLQLGIDAYGVDVATPPIEYAKRYIPTRFRRGSILQLPYPSEEYDTIICNRCIEYLSPTDIKVALAELHRVTRRFIVARVATASDESDPLVLSRHNRIWWETSFLNAGFRKHSLLQSVIPFGIDDSKAPFITVIFEKIPADAILRYPLTTLIPERDLHMDMFREPGKRSDAHIARYMIARQLIRKNDIVLDAGCGLGYGTALMADGSPAQQIIGIDESLFAIDYAVENFMPLRPSTTFQRGDLNNLQSIEDNSLDVVVCFEALEHLKDPDLFLHEAVRILKPGARFICSVPNMWVDKEGKDPNPFHFQIFDFTKLSSTLEKHFIIEQAYAQIGGGGMVLTNASPSMSAVDASCTPAVEAEWWIMIGMKDPVSQVTYVETVYAPNETSAHHPFQFSESYEYPWIQHSIVSIGLRAKTETALERIVTKFAMVVKEYSTEEGAILCVQAYSLLRRNPSFDETKILLQRIDAFIWSKFSSPMHVRWKISCAFASAQLCLNSGELEEATKRLRICTSFDFMDFTPALATKVVFAWIQIGKIASFKREPGIAKAAFAKAIAETERAIQAPWLDWISSSESPSEEIILEAGDLLNLAAEAAIALKALNHSSLYSWTLIPTSKKHTRLGLINELQKKVQGYHDELQENKKSLQFVEAKANERETYCIDLRAHLDRALAHANSLEQRIQEFERRIG